MKTSEDFNNSINSDNKEESHELINEELFQEKDLIIKGLKSNIINNKSEIEKIKEEIKTLNDKVIYEYNSSNDNNDSQTKLFLLDNKIEKLINDKDNLENKISQKNLLIEKYSVETENIQKKIEKMKKENKFLEKENEVINDDIKKIEKETLAIRKNLNQLEEDLLLSTNLKSINSKENLIKKKKILDEVNDLEKKLKDLQEFQNVSENALNDMLKSENELIEKKKENNINEIKKDEYNTLINNLNPKINKIFFLIANWVETYFGNNDIVFDKKDIPEIKDLNFINFDLLFDCLEKKRIIINSNLENLSYKFKELKNEKLMIKNNIEDLEKNNEALKKEKEKYDIEKNDLNEKINNLHKRLKLFNDNNINNQRENESIYNIKNEKFNLEYNLSLMRNKIKEIIYYNNELKNKIKEINNNQIFLNKKYNNKINDISNEINAKKVERKIIMQDYNDKFKEYEKINNKLKLDIEILKTKIKNIQTELDIKDNCLENIINRDGERNGEIKEGVYTSPIVPRCRFQVSENGYISISCKDDINNDVVIIANHKKLDDLQRILDFVDKNKARIAWDKDFRGRW